jgi:hypothetical protein
MTDEEYDEVTCITAGELRAQGFPILESIPDCGWIHRHSMRFHPGKCELYADDSTRIHVSISVEYTEAFRWIEFSITIDNEDGITKS